MAEQNIVALGYDAVYTALPKSPAFLSIWREHASGIDFPDEFAHISFVTLPELTRMAQLLQLAPGRTLVDLGCGMAGPGLWVARETGARIVGVDLSEVAVAQATVRAAALGMSERARFVVGSFAHTTLEHESADGIMSEDAMQYAPDKRALFREAARILRGGGRIVFTVFELDPPSVQDLPIIGADPVDAYQPLLKEAGFDVERYEEVPGWPEPMTAAYSAVLAARETLAKEMGDAAVAALASEMTLTLERKPYKRRVLAVATKR